MASNHVYTIGQLAKLSGVSPRTLRHYESLGLINPTRTESGYRTYTSQDAKRLAHILSMKQCGLTLSEIAELLNETAGQNVIKVLATNLSRLREQQQTLRLAIERTQQALAKAERIEHMSAKEAFESMKQKAVETWDKTYGAEARPLRQPGHKQRKRSHTSNDSTRVEQQRTPRAKGDRPAQNHAKRKTVQ